MARLWARDKQQDQQAVYMAIIYLVFPSAIIQTCATWWLAFMLTNCLWKNVHRRLRPWQRLDRSMIAITCISWLLTYILQPSHRTYGCISKYYFLGLIKQCLVVLQYVQLIRWHRKSMRTWTLQVKTFDLNFSI